MSQEHSSSQGIRQRQNKYMQQRHGRARKRENEKEQTRERMAGSPSPACVLTDPFPQGKEQVLRKLISPRRRKWGNYREDATGLGRTRF